MFKQDAFVIHDERGRVTFFLIGQLENADGQPLTTVSEEAEIMLFRLIDGFIDGCLEPNEMMVRFSSFDLPLECLEELAKKLGIKAASEKLEVILNADVLATAPDWSSSLN